MKFKDIEVGKKYHCSVIESILETLPNEIDDEFDLLVLGKSDNALMVLLDSKYHQKNHGDDLNKIKGMTFDELRDSDEAYEINEELDNDIIIYFVKEEKIITIFGVEVKFEKEI